MLIKYIFKFHVSSPCQHFLFLILFFINNITSYTIIVLKLDDLEHFAIKFSEVWHSNY